MKKTPHKHKKVSEWTASIQKYIGATNTEMGFIADTSEQIFKLYKAGRFDNSYGIRQEQFLARLVLLPELIDKRIERLLELKKRFQQYQQNPGRRYHPDIKKAVGKSGKKSVNISSSNGHNLKEKAEKK